VIHRTDPRTGGTHAGEHLHCVACEQQTAIATTLGVIVDDGRAGEVQGFACVRRNCQDLREASGAEPLFFGHLDLGGQSVLAFIINRLAGAGCNPGRL